MNFKYYLGDYEKKNGTRSVRLKFDTSKSDVQYLDSGISVQKSQWDPNRQKVKKHPLEESYNGELASLMNGLQKLALDNPNVSAKRLLAIYKGRKRHGSASFVGFYRSIISDKRLNGKTKTAWTMEKYVLKLELFGGDVAFSDLSLDFARDYERWMLEKGNAINTVASNFKALHSVINRAVRLGLIEKNPIKGHSVRSENTEKDPLSHAEIIKLSEMEIPDHFNGMSRARDMFLFSFYTAGMRFSDLCNLKWSNIEGNELIYRMGKSKSRSGSRRTFRLAPKAMGILSRYKGKDPVYVFPFLHGMEKKGNEQIERKIYIANNSVNRSLKILVEKAGIQKRVTMHTAKHSFADYAVKNDVNLLIISKLLGHTKLATTQHYLKDFYQKEESDEIDRLFGPI